MERSGLRMAGFFRPGAGPGPRAAKSLFGGVREMDTSNPPETARTAKVDLRRQRVRRDLARHAVRLIRERGFEATTVEAIAQAADYHPSSFFRYFARKEDAVFLGVPDATEQLRIACTDIQVGSDAWRLVTSSVASSVARFTEDEPEIFAFQFDIWMREPQLQAPLIAHLHQWEDILAAAFATSRGTAAPGLAEMVAAGAIVSVLRSAVSSPESAGTFPQRVAKGIDLVHRGFATHPFDA
jgi:AcrR family transcriptional regulator